MSSVTLVTGAAGFAGSHLLDLLAREGADVVAWHRPGEALPRGMSGLRWEPVELLDRTAVARAIAGLRPSVVYHLAGAAHVGNSFSASDVTFAINVRATHHVLDALERTGESVRVLIPSSALVYATTNEALTEEHALIPASPYGLSKLAQEVLGTRTRGRVAVTIARAFNHFGPRQQPQFAASSFAHQIAGIETGRWPPEIPVGNLDAQRDLTDVRDTVRAYRVILERGLPGRPYNVCSGHAITIGHLLALLIQRARVPVTVTVDPARYRPNDTPVLLGDPTRLRSELGWTPVIPLEQTLDDLLEYWRSEEPAG